MRIALVISTLRQGGAERLFIRLSKGFAHKRHTIALITLEASHRSDYPLPESVERISLNVLYPSTSLLGGIRNNIKRVHILRSALKNWRPHVVISALSETNITTLLAVQGLSIPVIISEHNDPEAFPLGRIWSLMRRSVYRRAARLVSVSQGVDSFFSWLPPEQRIVIPNPYDRTEIEVAADAPADFPKVDSQTIVALGRLVYVKGFDILLRAFAQIAASYPQWKLIIVGEGEERAALTSLIGELGLVGRAFLPGSLKAPHDYIRHGAFLAFPSRTEGFGLVLVEAFACGLPVVAFDCPIGPREIVQHQVNGYLIPPDDLAGFTDAMKTLMTDEEKRITMAGAALQSTSKFELPTIVARWEKLFADVAGQAADDTTL